MSGPAAGLTMPAALRPGDAVALVSPAGPSPAGWIDRAVDLVDGWGLTPVLMPSARHTHPVLSYLAGSDDARAADLSAAWGDPAYAGVLCLRGGYGTVRVLDRLDVAAWRAARPKRLFGSSDLTALHEFLADRVGVGSWFTPMPATSVADDAPAMAGLRRALFAELADWNLDPAGAIALAPGSATGRLAGGNLSLLAMTVGARGPTRPTGPVIAVLEDVGEPLYRLDGYLHALRRGGWFDSVVGIALGTWLDCAPGNRPGEPQGEASVHALVRDVLGDLGVPIAAGLRFGHGPGAASLPLGALVRLDVGPEASLLTLADQGFAPTGVGLTGGVS